MSLDPRGEETLASNFEEAIRSISFLSDGIYDIANV